MAPFTTDSNETLVNLCDCLLNANDTVPKVMLCMLMNDPPPNY
jgi:hypothetical protein